MYAAYRRCHREVCISRASFHLDVRRQANVILRQVSIDLFLTTEDLHLGIEVHGFSHLEARSFFFLFALSLAASGNEFFSSRYCRTKMTNLETKIKSKEEMERHETQENLGFVKETLSQFPPI